MGMCQSVTWPRSPSLRIGGFEKDMKSFRLRKSHLLHVDQPHTEGRKARQRCDYGVLCLREPSDRKDHFVLTPAPCVTSTNINAEGDYGGGQSGMIASVAWVF